MNQSLQLILEDADGSSRQAACERFAVLWQGREVWIQQDGSGQLLIGVDTEDGDTEFANLVLRPLASNLVGIQLEMEPMGDDEDGHVHGPDCGHDH